SFRLNSDCGSMTMLHDQASSLNHDSIKGARVFAGVQLVDVTLVEAGGVGEHGSTPSCVFFVCSTEETEVASRGSRSHVAVRLLCPHGAHTSSKVGLDRARGKARWLIGLYGWPKDVF